VHPHILCKQKRLFWMWLIVINHLTALVKSTSGWTLRAIIKF